MEQEQHISYNYTRGEVGDGRKRTWGQCQKPKKLRILVRVWVNLRDVKMVVWLLRLQVDGNQKLMLRFLGGFGNDLLRSSLRLSGELRCIRSGGGFRGRRRSGETPRGVIHRWQEEICTVAQHRILSEDLNFDLTPRS